MTILTFALVTTEYLEAERLGNLSQGSQLVSGGPVRAQKLLVQTVFIPRQQITSLSAKLP